MTLADTRPVPTTVPDASGDDTFDRLLRRTMLTVIRPYVERMRQVEERQRVIDGDPFWHIRSKPELLTVDEVAGILKVHEKTVRNYIGYPVDHALHLPHILIGSSYRVLPGELAEWLDRNRGAA
ncbi:MAG TPA: helix-turn-helix domain-containing protein [Arenicellales bacterium]|nr:helix-turn-helix domain-containing protein [Arenicellales bacterium]